MAPLKVRIGHFEGAFISRIYLRMRRLYAINYNSLFKLSYFKVRDIRERRDQIRTRATTTVNTDGRLLTFLAFDGVLITTILNFTLATFMPRRAAFASMPIK